MIVIKFLSVLTLVSGCIWPNAQSDRVPQSWSGSVWQNVYNDFKQKNSMSVNICPSHIIMILVSQIWYWILTVLCVLLKSISKLFIKWKLFSPNVIINRRKIHNLWPHTFPIYYVLSWHNHTINILSEFTCPVHKPTTKSAIKVSSVSPERWLTITPQPFSCAILHLWGGRVRQSSSSHYRSLYGTYNDL